MARIFLSMVTGEFKSYRQLLDAQLRTAGVEPVDQDHFAETGKKLLDVLDEKVRAADHVVHLVGRGTGAKLAECGVRRQQLEEFVAAGRDDFVARSGLAPYAEHLDALSYTQFEYWLARYYRKRALIYVADPGARRDPGFEPGDGQPAEQDEHLKRIEATFVQRGTVACAWSLAARVVVSLCASGAVPVIDPHEHPSIVLGLVPASDGGYRSSGAVRWGGRTITTADESAVDVDNRAAVCNRFTDLIRRGNVALAGHDVGERKTVVELVLPHELLARPLAEWQYRDERGVPAAVRDWHPVRVRLSGRTEADTSLSNIRARLALLRQHRDEVSSVCRAVPPGALVPGHHPLAVVHDDPAPGCWHPTAVVCGGFVAPPPRPRKGAKKMPEVLRAVYDGIPYLLWPDDRAQPDELVARLADCRRPAQLCLWLERQRFVVFAEAMHLPFPAAAPLFSDTHAGGRA